LYFQVEDQLMTLPVTLRLMRDKCRFKCDIGAIEAHNASMEAHPEANGTLAWWNGCLLWNRGEAYNRAMKVIHTATEVHPGAIVLTLEHGGSLLRRGTCH
jgi:hypothetical protein